jgi:hypothetical protein
LATPAFNATLDTEKNVKNKISLFKFLFTGFNLEDKLIKDNFPDTDGGKTTSTKNSASKEA